MLGGGVGCSRLAVALAAEIGQGRLTLIVNTADDMWWHGLRICPDLDTNLYALAGLRDEVRGWGLAGDTFQTMHQLGRLGHDTWFHLGDRDLATHILRTELLARGFALSDATAELAERLGVDTRLLPMTDSEVGTLLALGDGTRTFQEWFVKLGAPGPVEQVIYEGIEHAVPAPGVLEAIADADLVVLGPSNPMSSIEPILRLPDIRDHLIARRSSVVAVTPVVESVGFTNQGDAHRARARRTLLHTRGLTDSPSNVAALYTDLAATFVLDATDASVAPTIEANGQYVVLADTIITNAGQGRRLAQNVLACAARRRQRTAG